MSASGIDERPRLLIVDDEPKNLRLLANIFAEEYRLSLATSGRKALDLIEITPDIELILLDVMMPGMDGPAVYERIRAHPERQELPVVFVTARNDAALEMRALGSGAADYLLKPVHVGLARVRVRQQITLARQRRELQQARAAADAGNKAKSQFVTAISHELRTPLNAILGFSQVLESDETLAAAHRTQVQEIREAGTHLLALINDVLDLGKIEASKVDLSPEAIDLYELSQACLRLCEPLSLRHGVKLSVAFDVDTPLAWADRIRVRQVIVNLMSNAIKFNRNGGEVTLRLLRMPGGDARVEVVDNGPGIDAELRSRLFQPFSRGVHSERQQIEGTGIGLTICKRLVNLMGGQIDCISTPGLGSRFWFTLPQADEANAAEQALPLDVAGVQDGERPAAAAPALPIAALRTIAPSPASMPEAAPGAKPNPAGSPHRQHTILCIDDNPANLKLLQIVLKRMAEVTVVTSTDPTQAVTLAAQHRPSLVLVDIQMPEIDGYEVLKRLRAVPPLARVPVAALSANAMAEDIRTGLAAGFVAYHTKPFDVQELLASVQKLLEQHPHEPPSAPAAYARA